jgi:hypothetical protein
VADGEILRKRRRQESVRRRQLVDLLDRHR